MKPIDLTDLTVRQKLLAQRYARQWRNPAATLSKVYPGLCRSAFACGMDRHDLRSCGWQGVLAAAKKYDPAFGCSFATYALQWIRARVAHEVSNRTAGRRGGGRRPLSGDLPARRDEPGGAPCWDLWGVSDPADPAGDPAEFDRLDRLRDALRDALRFLDPYRRRVLELRYGLADGRARTLDETAAALGRGTTRERVRQVEAKAFERLRVPLMLAAGHLAGGVAVAGPPPSAEPSARSLRPKVHAGGRRRKPCPTR